MSMEWWRCKHGAPFDPKWRAVALRAQSRPGDVWAVFTTLCDRASQASDRGSIEGVDLEDVAAGLGYEIEEIQRIFTALKARGIVTDERVAKWETHQTKREDNSTERVRAHRNAMKRDETQSNSREEKRRLDKIEPNSEGVVDAEALRASRSRPAQNPDLRSKPLQKTQKGSRWPSDAVVPEDWIEAAEKYREDANLPPIDLRLEALRFANYWASKAGGNSTKTDWKRTWHNWTIDEKKNGKPNGSGQSGQLDPAAAVFRENYLSARAKREGVGG